MTNKQHQLAVQEAVKGKFRGHQPLRSRSVPHYPDTAEREFKRVTNGYIRLLKKSLMEHLPSITLSRPLTQRETPVTVRIDETDGLLPGMNVDAQIVLEQAEDVLAIPSGAVNRGDTVLITADSPSAASALDQEAPEGYVYVSVETGVSDDSYIEILSGLQVSDDSYIEILSGLQEGDTVAYIPTSSGGGMSMMMGGAMAMGGGGGAMVVGGGPSGGGPRG